MQFTGGEPLLHKRVADFVRRAKEIVPTVGITTNGTLLHKHYTDLVDAKISRVHISLQSATLELATPDRWSIPEHISVPARALANSGAVVRYTLPVASGSLMLAEEFLEYACELGFTYNLFALLPATGNGNERVDTYLTFLENLAERINTKTQSRNGPVVVVRTYTRPNGLRCGTCPDRVNCKEQSRSLRLGVDEVLRPCLASRLWDIPLNGQSLEQRVWQASVLATDW